MRCLALRLRLWAVLAGIAWLGVTLVRGELWVPGVADELAPDCRLWLALDRDDLPGLRQSLSQGATVESCHPDSRLEPMIAAAAGADSRLLRELLAEGADPNCESASGQAPLHFAACCGRIENVCELLQSGADINAMSQRQVTPLLAAVRGGHPATISLLLDRGAKAQWGNGELVEAVELTAATPALIDRLIAAGADVNAANQAGITPLRSAISAGRSDLAMLLLHQGAREFAESHGSAAGDGLAAHH